MFKVGDKIYLKEWAQRNATYHLLIKEIKESVHVYIGDVYKNNVLDSKDQYYDIRLNWILLSPRIKNIPKVAI